MKWQENINTLKEIYPGHYQIILDFATTKILPFLISDRYRYIWVHNHTTHDSLDWKPYELPLFGNSAYQKVMARNISFDYAMVTNDFKSIMPRLDTGITLIQLNELPKNYLDPARITGKSRYELLLKECDYLFEIDLPNATDYGTLISSDRNYLQSLLDNSDLNWDHLP